MSFEGNVDKNLTDSKRTQSMMAQEFVSAIRTLSGRGWTPATGGNFSCLLSRDPLEMLMSPSGIDKGQVEQSDLIVVDKGARVLCGAGKASAETLIHNSIYTVLDVGCVLHTHSVPNTILSRRFLDKGYLELSGFEMLKALPGIETHETSIRVPIFANSQDMKALSESITSYLTTYRDSKAILLSGHGLYAWGASITEASRAVEALEFLLEVQLNELMINGVR